MVVNREQLQVLIVEGNPLTREGMLAVVNRHPALGICHQAADARAAREIFPKERPQMVVLDIALRHGDGIELVREFSTSPSECRCVIVSTWHDSATVDRAFQAGAYAFISKADETAELRLALEAVITGRTYLSRTVSQSLRSAAARRIPSRVFKLMNNLSDRELHVFRRMGMDRAPRKLPEN